MYRNLPDDEFDAYLAKWNRNANKNKIEFNRENFDCIFVYDYNRMLGFYQQAGLDFVQLYEGRGSEGYIFSKTKIIESYNLLLESSNNK